MATGPDMGSSTDDDVEARAHLLDRLDAANSIASAQAIALAEVEPGQAAKPSQVNLLRFLAVFTSRRGGFRIHPNQRPLPVILTDGERRAYAAFAQRLAAAGQLPLEDLEEVERLLHMSSDQQS